MSTTKNEPSTSNPVGKEEPVRRYFLILFQNGGSIPAILKQNQKITTDWFFLSNWITGGRLIFGGAHLVILTWGRAKIKQPEKTYLQNPAFFLAGPPTCTTTLRGRFRSRAAFSRSRFRLLLLWLHVLYWSPPIDAGGYYKAVERAKRRGCDCVQLFTGNNNQWAARPVTSEDGRRSNGISEHGISHPIAHDSYLINLASPDLRLWKKSVAALVEELRRAEILGIPYVVAHPGAYTTGDERRGYAG